MPTYTYECENGHYTRLIQHMREARPATVTCKECKGTASRIFHKPQTVNIEPFVTYVGDGERKVVRNSAEAKDIEKKFKVAEIGSQELKRISDPDYLRKRKERIRREAQASLGPIREDYVKAEAMVKTWGKEYEKEFMAKQAQVDRDFQREIEAGNVNC